MAKCPEKQAKLRKLIDEAVASYSQWSYDKIKTVTYIDDWISETLRLRPALLTSGARVTPKHGMQVDEVFIPGDTNVVIPMQMIHRDHRWWPQAEDFIPERFGEKRAEMETNQAPYLPFSLGEYGCPGKHLANMSLRIAISAIVQNFEVSFGLGEDGRKFEEETLDTFTVTLPPLQLKFEPRV